MDGEVAECVADAQAATTFRLPSVVVASVIISAPTILEG